jgi:hypothetical protein
MAIVSTEHLSHTLLETTMSQFFGLMLILFGLFLVCTVAGALPGVIFMVQGKRLMDQSAK